MQEEQVDEHSTTVPVRSIRELERLSYEHRPLIDRALSTLRQPIADYSFASLYIWSSSLDLRVGVCAHHVCVFALSPGDTTMLLPPLPLPGASPAELFQAVDTCFLLMDEENRDEARNSRIEYVSDELLEQLRSVRQSEFSAAPMNGDYVYDCAQMIELPGKSFRSKRRAKEKFEKDYPSHRTEPMGPEHVPACMDLLNAWTYNGHAKHEGEVTDQQIGTDILREREALATRLALENFNVLGLTGMVLMVEDKLIGFTLGEKVAPDMAVVVIEKTHPAYSGSAQYIFSEFCRQYWADCRFINACDDWGIPSLRFTKQSYRPIRLLSKYVLTRQGSYGVQGGWSSSELPSLRSALDSHRVPSPTVPAGGVEMAKAGIGSEYVELRPASLADAGTILEIERACFHAIEETFNLRQIRSLIRNPRAAVLVATIDGDVVGWSVGLTREHRHYRSGRVYAVAIHPSARGRKLGQALTEGTLAELTAKGIRNVYLEVRSDNEAAIRLYQKLGFVFRRELRDYYGQGRHGIRMMRVLPRAGSSEQKLEQSGEFPGVVTGNRSPRHVRRVRDC